MNQSINRVFYQVKPIIPRSVQINVRRFIAKARRPFIKHYWPIYEPSGTKPADWRGWPGGKQFGVILTHDVEMRVGLNRCVDLMKMEADLGFRSLFNIVPERYGPSLDVREELQRNGFEVGIHGLNHDGCLFKSRDTFNQRAQQINQYIREWGAVGFRAPAMHHDLEWLKELDIEYDMSTFDIDPFEPQADGVKTIFPFIVPRTSLQDGYVEMPYTLPQDHGIFIIQKEKNIDIWKRKVDWIVEKGGMVLVNVHPDYMNFGIHKTGPEEFPVDYYYELLEYIKSQYAGQYWHGVPSELAAYIKKSVVDFYSYG